MKNLFLTATICLFISHFAVSGVKNKNKDKQSTTTSTSAAGKVTWGPELKKDSRREIFTDVIGRDDQGTYIFSEKIGGMFTGFKATPNINCFDKDLDIRSCTEIQLKSGTDKLTHTFTFLSDGKILSFGYYKDSKNNTYTLYYDKLDSKTGIPSGSLVKAVELEFANKTSGERLGKGAALNNNVGLYSPFFCNISPDSSKIVIISTLTDRKEAKEGDSHVGIYVFDKDMNQLWQKDATIPLRPGEFNIRDYLVDDEGNVDLLLTTGKSSQEIQEAKNAKKEKGEKGRVSRIDFSVLSYQNGGKDFNENKITLTDYTITDLKIGVTNDGNVVAAGFYSEKVIVGGSIKGTFYMTIDPQSGKVLKQGIKAFDTEFLSEFMSDKKAEKGKELAAYDMKSLYLHADGGATLLAEQYYVYSVTYIDSHGGSHTTYYYNYNDIIAVSIRPDNSIEWAVRIPKRQVTANDHGYFSSFASMVQGDNIYIVFNDNAKNLTSNDIKHPAPFNGKKSTVVVVIINAEGKYKKQQLFSNKDAQVITRPKVCEQIGNSEMLMLGEFKRKFKLARVEFKS